MSKKTSSQNKTSKLAKTGSETFSWSITLTIATIIFILLIGGASDKQSKLLTNI